MPRLNPDQRVLLDVEVVLTTMWAAYPSARRIMAEFIDQFTFDDVDLSPEDDRGRRSARRDRSTILVACPRSASSRANSLRQTSAIGLGGQAVSWVSIKTRCEKTILIISASH